MIVIMFDDYRNNMMIIGDCQVIVTIYDDYRDVY